MLMSTPHACLSRFAAGLIAGSLALLLVVGAHLT
jgi:hypothetical protein